MKAILKFTLCSLISLVSTFAFATQYVDASDASGQRLNISDKELTRIAIDGGYITNLKAVKGEADTQKDTANGEVYLRPLVKKPINIFVKSEAGRSYLLILNPMKMGADNIIIREGAWAQKKQYDANQALQRERKSLQRNSESYTSAVKKFMYGMATNSMMDDISCSIAGEEVPLWKEAILVRKSRCSTENLSGQIFSLHNVSNQTMVIDEQEFYKKGVIAVAIKQHTLNSNDETEIYIVFGAN
mgnify:CR=1 FL=1